MPYEAWSQSAGLSSFNTLRFWACLDISVHVFSQRHLTAAIQRAAIIASSTEQRVCIKFCGKLENTKPKLAKWLKMPPRGGREPYASGWVVPPLQRWAHMHRKCGAEWTYFAEQKWWGDSKGAWFGDSRSTANHGGSRWATRNFFWLTSDNIS
jgi:hypothetical protein